MNAKTKTKNINCYYYTFIADIISQLNQNLSNFIIFILFILSCCQNYQFLTSKQLKVGSANVTLNINHKKINPLQNLRFMEKRLFEKEQLVRKSQGEEGISFQMMSKKMIWVLIPRQSTEKATLKIASKSVWTTIMRSKSIRQMMKILYSLIIKFILV